MKQDKIRSARYREIDNAKERIGNNYASITSSEISIARSIPLLSALLSRGEQFPFLSIFLSFFLSFFSSSFVISRARSVRDSDETVIGACMPLQNASRHLSE